MSTDCISAPTANGAFRAPDAAIERAPGHAVLETLVRLAIQVLPSSIDASITLVRDENPATVVASGRVAMALDERQYAHRRGPCLYAAQTGQLVAVPDMTGETRWPEFTGTAADTGVSSSLSVPLDVEHPVGATLNIYGADSRICDGTTIRVAEVVARHAAAAVAVTLCYESTAALAEHMRQAMESRATIEQAKGIVMRDRGCTADEAFATLIKLSQRTHVKLRDIAQLLVDSVAEASSTPASASDRTDAAS